MLCIVLWREKRTRHKSPLLMSLLDVMMDMDLTHVFARSLARALLAQTKALSKSGPPVPRFEIKKWNAVAMWSWDICADTVRYYYYNTYVAVVEVV